MKIKKLAAICLTGALTLAMMTGCGINKNEVLATANNDVEVTLGVANFMATFQQAEADEWYRSIFGEDVWQQDLYQNGSTMEENVVEQVVESLHEMYTLKGHMDEYGVSISEEEQTAITTAAQEFIEENSPKALKAVGASEEIVTEVLTLYTIQEKMKAAIIAGADQNVSAEEANMRAFSILTIGTTSYTDESGNTAMYTEDEIAELGAIAETIVSLCETPDELENAAALYGYELSEDTYAADDEDLDASLKAALDKLAEGEMSGVIATEKAYYVVRLDAETDKDATEKHKQEIISGRQSTLYNEVLKAWQTDDGWTVDQKVVDKIKFTNVFTTTAEKEAEDGTEE